VVYNGQFNTVGSQITQSYTDTGSTLVFKFGLAAGQTVSTGATFTFAAQIGGNGTPHPYTGDTYSVTYTAGGVSYTKNGVM
jgi:hypothetical protein